MHHRRRPGTDLSERLAAYQAAPEARSLAQMEFAVADWHDRPVVTWPQLVAEGRPLLEEMLWLPDATCGGVRMRAAAMLATVDGQKPVSVERIAQGMTIDPFPAIAAWSWMEQRPTGRPGPWMLIGGLTPASRQRLVDACMHMVTGACSAASMRMDGQHLPTIGMGILAHLGDGQAGGIPASSRGDCTSTG